MELLNPIFVKRWVSENKYIEYVFDVNVNVNHKNKIVISGNTVIDSLKKSYHKKVLV